MVPLFGVLLFRCFSVVVVAVVVSFLLLFVALVPFDVWLVCSVVAARVLPAFCFVCLFVVSIMLLSRCKVVAVVEDGETGSSDAVRIGLLRLNDLRRDSHAVAATQ